MKNTRKRWPVHCGEANLIPADLPLEAAMLPAREASARGALHHAKAMFRLKSDERASQRQKIWVR